MAALTQAQKDRIILEGKRDAEVFVDENAEAFDPAATDWDGTAWNCFYAQVLTEGQDIWGEGYALYQTTLEAETKRLMELASHVRNAHARRAQRLCTQRKRVMADTSTYRQEQTLAESGISVCRANRFEEARNAYGEKLIWVVDLDGNRQARTPYRTKQEALQAAETYL